MPNNLAKIVYLIAFAEAAAGILLALWLWPGPDSAKDACRTLSSLGTAMLECQAAFSATLNYTRGLSIASGVGGVLGAVLTYALAEILDRVSALQDRADMILHRSTRIDERLEQQALAKRRETAPV